MARSAWSPPRSGRPEAAWPDRHSNERDRRPIDEELEKLIAHFHANPRQIMPMGRIFRVTWSDLNARTKMLMIRDRKDPRQKKGNDQRIPLLAVSGYDALALIEEQRAIPGNEDAAHPTHAADPLRSRNFISHYDIIDVHSKRELEAA